MICLVIMVNAFWRLYRCDKYAQNKISNLKISMQVIAFGAYVLSNYMSVLIHPSTATIAKVVYYMIWVSSALSLGILVLTLIQIADLQRRSELREVPLEELSAMSSNSRQQTTDDAASDIQIESLSYKTPL